MLEWSDCQPVVVVDEPVPNVELFKTFPVVVPEVTVVHVRSPKVLVTHVVSALILQAHVRT